MRAIAEEVERLTKPESQYHGLIKVTRTRLGLELGCRRGTKDVQQIASSRSPSSSADDRRGDHRLAERHRRQSVVLDGVISQRILDMRRPNRRIA